MAAQIAGFVLTDDGAEIRALRYATPPDAPADWEPPAVWRLSLPVRSAGLLARPLLRAASAAAAAAATASTIPVLLLRPGGGRFDAGDVDVREYVPLDTTVVLVRRTPATANPANPVTVTTAAHGVAPPLGATGGSGGGGSDAAPTLSDRYAAVWTAWGVDAVWRDPVVALPAAATLYGALPPATVEWCGPANRFGSNAVLWDALPRYPDRTVFAAAKGCAAAHRLPVLLCYGAPDPVPTPDRPGLDDNCGVQTILFRPGTGESTRVHYLRRRAAAAAAAGGFVIGEIGDANADGE